MGRRPKPVSGDVEELVELAQALRELRAQAGNPPLHDMAVRARYSASTLSACASGRQLPTLPVVLAYVSACGGEVAQWEERWRRAAAAVAAGEGQGTRPENPDLSPSRPVADVLPAPTGRRKLILSLTGVTAAALLTAAGLLWSPHHTANGRAAVLTTATASSMDDTDPKDSGCDSTARTVASTNTYGPARLFLGQVILRYSPQCRTMWARFDPVSTMDKFPGAQFSLSTYRPRDANDVRFSVPYTGYFVWGNMLSTDKGCVEARVYITMPRPTSGPQVALPGRGPITVQASTRCVQL